MKEMDLLEESWRGSSSGWLLSGFALTSGHDDVLREEEERKKKRERRRERKSRKSRKESLKDRVKKEKRKKITVGLLLF